MADPIDPLVVVSGIQQAKDAGYTPDEIYGHLATRPEFAAARDAGYSFDEVYQHLYSGAQKKAQAMQQSAMGVGTPVGGMLGMLSGALKFEPGSKEMQDFFNEVPPEVQKKMVGEMNARTEEEWQKEVGPFMADQLKQHYAQRKQGVGDEDQPLVYLPKPSGDGAVASLTRGAEQSAEGLATLKNIGILGASMVLPKPLQKVVGAGFLAMMAKGAVDEASTVIDPIASKAERLEAAGRGLAGAALVGLGLKGEFGPETEGGATPAERQGGLTQEQADAAATQNQLRTLAPETAAVVDPKPTGSPDVLDGMTLARRKLTEGFADAPPDQQKARQFIIDHIDDVLLSHDRTAVNESAARTAQPEPPTGQQEPPTKTEAPASPPVQGGRSTLFTQAALEAAETPSPLVAKALESSPPPPDKKDLTDVSSGSQDGGVTPEPVFSREEIQVSKPQVSRRKRPTGTDGESVTTVEAPSKISSPENWHRLGDINKVSAHVHARINFETGKVPKKSDPVWTAYGGRSTARNAEVIKRGVTYDEAVEAAKDYVHSANPTEPPETPSPPPQVERAPALAAEERTVADEKAGAAEVEQPARQSPLDQLKALNEDLTKGGGQVEKENAQENEKEEVASEPAVVQPNEQVLPGEKLAGDLRKLGRVNRDPAQSVARELSYYSDEERQQLQEHLGTEDANPDTLAKAITGKPKLKEASRPSEYVDEPGGKEGRGHPSDFGEDYTGGPGAMGPREAEALKSAQASTGLKKATVLTERLARGEEPLPAAERQSETEAVGRAMETQDRDPAAPRNLVARILDKGDTAITRDEAALLLVERNRVTEDMRQADARLNNPEASELERTEAKENLKDLETQIDRLDRAQREAGSQWGRVGRMYQQMIREDYSLEGIQRKMRTAKGGPLTEAERTESSKLAEATQKAIDAQEKAAAARTVDQEKDDLKYFYEKTIADLKSELAKAPKISKPVLDIAQKIVDRWKGEADEARKSLRARLGRTSAGVDPTIVLDVAKIMRAHVGEIGLDLAKVTARVLEDFGEEVKPYLKDAWKKARDLIDKEGGPAAAREAAKKGLPAKEKTPTDIAGKAKAEATAGEELSNQTVYELARAHIKAGVHGEDAVMAAVHKDIKEAYPGATERDVRRAFSDYGKTKFPSQEAVAKELRELRTLTRLQESIDRLKEGQDALKTGPQRDKASQEIREKQKQLDELLKTRQGPPSPEKLASREEAKVNALKNRIADIDKELKTGERPPDSTPLPDSPAVEQLKAERDAMQEKLNEIRGEGKEKPTPEESYNKRRMTQITKQVADLEDRLKTGNLEKEKPVPLKKTAEVAAAEAKLTAVRREVDKAIEKKKYDQLSPQQKFFKEAMSTLHSITALKILGHGSVGMVTHAGALIFRPTRAVIYWRNFGRQFAMWAKPELHEQLIHRLKNDPEFETWKKAGASIDPDKTYTDYGMYAQWLGKLGEAGGRGFDALKLVRMELNKADWKGVPDEIKDDPKQADAARKLIAEINNKATGTAPKSSPVGKTIEEGFYGAAKNPITEAAFFAPRLYASRWGRVLFDPVKTVRTLMDPASSPVERFAANKKLKNAAEFTGTLLGALLIDQAILSATGSKQNVNLTDPKKSDWLKFKAGDKTITADGGLLDPVRLVGQVMWKDLLAERTKSEQYREGTRFKMAADTVANYLRGKLSPPVGLATDVATGSDFQGRPLPWSKDKPQFKDQTPYTYGEWLLDQGPIPLEGAAKEVAAEVKKQGFKDHEVQVILRAAMAFGLGMAGVHVGDDYSNKPKPSDGFNVKVKKR